MSININVDFSKKISEIKAMHGVGQPPFDGIDESMFHYIKDAGIPYSRLHDVGGSFGCNMFVDIHNIFRDFNADVNDENSYDFTFTDWLLTNIQKSDCRIIYRLGETIENYHYMKAYRIFPPKDNQKWAEICEHIIKHYNEGWANGFHMNIEYWEIWNEPDNGRDDTENQMWHGTPQQFYELYSVAATHLKKVFGDKIKVGGYATCGFRHILSDPQKFGANIEKADDNCYSNDRSANFIRFFEGFFAYIKKTNAPLDFFSWHSYLTTDRTVACAEYLDRRLTEFGFGDVETQVNEWNNVMEDREDYDKAVEIGNALKGTGMAAAKTASMMCAMQNTKTKILCYYDARIGIGPYAGMFNPETYKPYPLYYAFSAFNELYKLKNSVLISFEKTEGLYALAAENDGKKAILTVNASDKPLEITTNLPDDLSLYLVDDTKKLEKIDGKASSYTLPAGSFILIK